MRASSRYFQTTASPRYDPSVRDYVLDAEGYTVDEHPVDQRVILLLSTLVGTIAGDPTSGNGVRSVKRIGTQEAKNKIVRAVTLCVQQVVDDGDIEVLDVEVDFPVPKGRTHIVFTYRNLRSGNEMRAIVQGGNLA